MSVSIGSYNLYIVGTKTSSHITSNLLMTCLEQHIPAAQASITEYDKEVSSFYESETTSAASQEDDREIDRSSRAEDIDAEEQRSEW